jgi:hypothetical protein
MPTVAFRPMTYEIYGLAVLQEATFGRDWYHVCRQWHLDPSTSAYGVVYAKDRHGEECRLFTLDIDFVRSLPDRGEVPPHEWTEVRAGWYAADTDC